jgi:hypothetical protein
MGTICWIQDNGAVFGISDGRPDDVSVVATRYVVWLREMSS